MLKLHFLGLLALLTPLYAADRPVISSQDQLPRFEYPAPSPVTLILTDEEAFATLAEAVRRDVEGLLRDYDITDRTTRQGLIGTLMTLDIGAGDDEAALARIADMRALEEKPANRLTMGLLAESVIETRRLDHASEAVRRARFAEIYAEKINALPHDVVQDNIKSSKASAEIFSEALLLGAIAAQVQPGVFARTRSSASSTPSSGST
jgi:hypothetical protein